MKRSPLLHAELSHVIASLGHGDMLVLGDAGLRVFGIALPRATLEERFLEGTHRMQEEVSA